jgi:NADPH2:quinone reductase
MVKAIRFHETGGPDVLQWEDVEVGDPGDGQVRIRHTAIAVNFRDIYVRKGSHSVATLPSGLGIDAAGIIDAVGPDVSGLKPGDRVACVAGPDGAYAEARLVPAARVVPLPSGISEQLAAAMMVRGMTARYLLRQTYPVQPGDTILVHAAAGGVGLIMCQWAAHLGATVIGTVGSAEKAAFAAAHGCHHPIVYTTEEFVARVREITDGDGVAVVYDSVGLDTFEKSLDCLRPRGTLASFGEASGNPPPIDPGILGAKGALFLTHPSLGYYTASRDELLECANELFDMVEAGHVKMEIARTYALRNAADAHRDLEQRKIIGAVVLLP